MAEKFNAICPVCGKGFKMCVSCEANGIASWKTLTDTEDCFKVFHIVHDVCVSKKITKEQAKEQLKGFDFSDIDTYPETVKTALKDILGIKEKVNAESNKEIIKEKGADNAKKINYAPKNLRK